jgi:hypothetical protein
LRTPPPTDGFPVASRLGGRPVPRGGIEEQRRVVQVVAPNRRTAGVTYQKFDCFPMSEFSQKFKTFCLNLCAVKFYPNLLASHLKPRIKLKPYLNYFQTRVKM